MVLVIMLYKVILTFESVDEILKCDHRFKLNGYEEKTEMMVRTKFHEINHNFSTNVLNYFARKQL